MTSSAALSIGLPSGVSGKFDARTSTGEYYQMTNPFYGVEGSYKWQSKTIGLGSNKDKAVEKANKILLAHATYLEWENLQPKQHDIQNNHYVIDKPTWQAISPRADKTINELCDFYIGFRGAMVAKGKLAASTLAQDAIYLEDIKEFWQGYPLEYLDDGNIQSHVDRYFEFGKINSSSSKEHSGNHGRAAEALRSVYINMLKTGKRKKRINFKQNPALCVQLEKVEIQRSRCSLEIYNAVYELASNNNEKHFALGFLLSLVTKLRLTDTCLIRNKKGDDWNERVKFSRENANLKQLKKVSFQDRIEKAAYSYIDDENQELVVFQQKTGVIFRIEFDHKVSEQLPSVGEVIKLIRKTCHQDSAFLIHHPKKRGLALKGAPIQPNSLSRRFTHYVKQYSHENNIVWFKTKPPSIAELRSLGSRLLKNYQKENDINNQVTDQNKQCFASQSNNQNIVFATIAEELEHSPSANQGITQSLGHKKPSMKLLYTKERQLVDGKDFFPP